MWGFQITYDPIQSVTMEKVVGSTLDLHVLLMGCHCSDSSPMDKTNKWFILKHIPNIRLRATSHNKTASPWPLHFKHSHWWKSRSKFVSHYAWGTNVVCECNMDVKSTWIPTWHRSDHVSWSLGEILKTTSWR